MEDPNLAFFTEGFKDVPGRGNSLKGVEKGQCWQSERLVPGALKLSDTQHCREWWGLRCGQREDRGGVLCHHTQECGLYLLEN